MGFNSGFKGLIYFKIISIIAFFDRFNQFVVIMGTQCAFFCEVRVEHIFQFAIQKFKD